MTRIWNRILPVATKMRDDIYYKPLKRKKNTFICLPFRPHNNSVSHTNTHSYTPAIVSCYLFTEANTNQYIYADMRAQKHLLIGMLAESASL